MNCTKCGKEIKADEKFCRFCGEKNVGYVSESNVKDSTYKNYSVEEFTVNNPVRINNSYYDLEFIRIEQGKKSRFNWAAFFFGPLMALYRKMYKFFIKIYLPLIVMSVITMILFALDIYLISKGISVEYAGIGFFVIVALYLIINIYGFICFIRGGKRYNVYYYYHLKEAKSDIKKEHLLKPSVLGPIVFIFLCVASIAICIFAVVIPLIPKDMESKTGIFMPDSIIESEYNADESAIDGLYYEYSYLPASQYLGMTVESIEENLGADFLVEVGDPNTIGEVLFLSDTNICPYSFLVDEFFYDVYGVAQGYSQSIVSCIYVPEGEVDYGLPANITFAELQNTFDESQLTINRSDVINGWVIAVQLDEYTIMFLWSNSGMDEIPTVKSDMAIIGW